MCIRTRKCVCTYIYIYIYIHSYICIISTMLSSYGDGRRSRDPDGSAPAPVKTPRGYNMM